MSFYNSFSQNINKPSYTLKADPYYQAASSYSILEKQDLVKPLLEEYSLKELENYLTLTQSPNTGIKISAEYYERIRIKNNNNQEINRVIRILLNSPKIINKDSIIVYDNKEILRTNTINNWYQTIISVTNNNTTPIINESLRLTNIPLRVSETQDLNETSMQAYYENKKTLMEINNIDYNKQYYDANSSFEILIPHMDAYTSKKIILLYAGNETVTKEDYTILNNPIILPHSSSLPEKSGKTELLINTSMKPYEEKELTISYGINTNTKQEYYDLTKYDNTGISIEEHDTYYIGTYPRIFEEPSSTKNVQKNIFLDNKEVSMNIKTWYYE